MPVYYYTMIINRGKAQFMKLSYRYLGTTLCPNYCIIKDVDELRHEMENRLTLPASAFTFFIPNSFGDIFFYILQRTMYTSFQVSQSEIDVNKNKRTVNNKLQATIVVGTYPILEHHYNITRLISNDDKIISR